MSQDLNAKLDRDKAEAGALIAQITADQRSVMEAQEAELAKVQVA